MTSTSYKYIIAQKDDFALIKSDLLHKNKLHHWIWFVFPQAKRLGTSFFSNYYGFASGEEVRDFFNNKILKANTINYLKIILKWDIDTLHAFFGNIDFKKFHSSMTIFYIFTKDGIFKKVLDKFYNGELDKDTLDIVKEWGKN